MDKSDAQEIETIVGLVTDGKPRAARIEGLYHLRKPSKPSKPLVV